MHIFPRGSEIVKLTRKLCFLVCRLRTRFRIAPTVLRQVRPPAGQAVREILERRNEERTHQCLVDFDGMVLKLDGHVIMKRGLSYQAYQAYLHRYKGDRGVEVTCLYGFPGIFQYKSMTTLMEQQYSKDVEEETGDT